MDRDPSPTVRVLLGEEVTFVTDATPLSVTLTAGGTVYPLGSGRTSRWIATGRSGPARLTIRTSSGTATFGVWLAITDDVQPAKLWRRPGAVRRGEPLVIETDQPVTLEGCVRARPVGRGMKRDITSRRLSVGANRVGIGHLPPGRYSIRLRARDLGGNLTRHDTTFVIKR